MLLADYAITPDVVDVNCYSGDEVCGIHLEKLKEVMLSEGLVRDLRVGEWSRLFTDSERSWHHRGKELLKKLVQQGRLVPFEPILEGPPEDDPGWCREAIGTNAVTAFSGGIIVTDPVKEAFPDEPIVASINRLSGAPWWAARSSSVRLARSLDEYLTQLAPILRCANSLMFIDPYLDPGRSRYRDFPQLIAAAGNRHPAPAVELHRVCWENSSDKRAQPEYMRELENSFRNVLQNTVQRSGLRLEAFFWSDFHDRYLISNLVGISLPNGFDTTTDRTATTTWARLGRSDRDEVQREFDPARHAPCHRFVIE
jgi:hypothetical protein